MKTLTTCYRIWSSSSAAPGILPKCAAQYHMKAWQAPKFGQPDVLELSAVTRPTLQHPKDVLIQVQATSVNPIDVRMLNGYGESMMKALRCTDNCGEETPNFPLILGRDFIGTIVDYGKAVKKFHLGDKVWGTVAVQRQGCHAEYVVARSSTISRPPSSVTAEEAASLPFVALTAKAAWNTAGSFLHQSRQLRALVLGGTGGVGTFAIQYLKFLGLEVTTTCNADAEDIMYEMGANFVVDYKREDATQRLNELKGFDFILDAAGVGPDPWYLNLLKGNGFSKFVTLTSPLLQNTDKFGFVLGTAVSAANAVQDTVTGLVQGKSIRWAFFVEDGKFLREVADLVDNNKIKPVVDRVFQFEDAQEAYTHVAGGHARGKSVITLTKGADSQTV